MNTRKHLSAVVLPLLFSFLTGCTSLGLKTPNVWPLNIADDKPGMPSQVVANWTDTILYQGSQVPVRGFGGRLIFYTDGKKEPVKVEGTLAVYAFDEKNRDPNNAKPDRKFVFTKDQLATHYSKSKLGHSYSVWIPWDDAGGEQKDISLIVRFMPEKGSAVVSEQTKHILPGKTEMLAGNANLPAFTPGNGSIQPVGYAAPMTPAYPNVPGIETKSSAPRSMVTTTIPIPPSSILKTPPMNTETNSGAFYPQSMPAAGSNHAMPYGQMPSTPLGTEANPAANTFIGPSSNQTAGAAINSTYSSNPQYPACPPPNRSGLGQSRVPRASFSPPMPYRAPWPPSPLGPGFGPGASSAAAINGGFPGSPEVAGSPMN
jgi:hypothetical protein